ncbi:biotinidase [Erpetoichthys calabaricus]|nr:biotinidase [Erpetoichthys calabaricus]
MLIGMDWKILAYCVGFYVCHVVVSSLHRRGNFTAAVYEHQVILNPNPSVPLSRQSALKHMKKNLDIYEEQVALAAKQGAQLIVFPEDGIHGFNFTRQSIEPYLERIPDPKSIKWSPCLNPGRFPNTEVLHRLSCMAKTNRIYVVANMPDRQDCLPRDPHCPPDGRYQFNTDVVFSDDGTIVARYHKQNLYFEAAFDTPVDYEYVIFDTSFAGPFGIFTCFDILFYEPAVTLIEKFKLKQIVFPTAWMNQLPLLSAIQIQRSFASAFGLNLLAANIHQTDLDMTGSGIYTPSHSLYHYDMDSHNGRLLVATIPVISDSSNDDTLVDNWHLISSRTLNMAKTNNLQFCDNEFEECSGHFPSQDPFMKPFHALMMYDNYTFTPLLAAKGNVAVCDGSLCCHLSYERSPPSSELYALGAFNGLHVVHGTYYLEVCALVKCPGSHWHSCGGGTIHASSALNFHLWGNFTTRFIFPQILASEMQLHIPDKMGWEKTNFFMTKSNMSAGLITAALYGRVYEKDKGPDDKP